MTTPEDLVREQIGNMALHAVRNKEANVKQVLDHITACDKALAGLPKVAEAAQEVIAGLEAGQASALEEIERLRNDPELSPVLKGQLDNFTELADSFCKLNKLYSKSLSALAKTQVGFAKILKHELTLSLIQVSSDRLAQDATELANRMGKGQEAVAAYARNRFPGVFNAQPEPFVATPEGSSPFIAEPEPPPSSPAEEPPEFGFQDGA